jgi:hypothetical protein
MTLSASDTGMKAWATGEDTVSVGIHLAWFVAGAVLGLLIPFVFTSLLSLHHDLYYLTYFVIILGFLGIYVEATHVDLVGLFKRKWHWSLAIGLAAAAALVLNVISRGPTPRPTGPYLIFESLWRGATYGVVDALLLTAFPGLVALGLLKGNLAGFLRKAIRPYSFWPAW